MLAPRSCQTARVNDRLERLRDARLYLVCDERADDCLEAALRGGVDIVQLRIKDGGGVGGGGLPAGPAGDRRLVDVARRFARVCARHGALLILNDRPDLVAAAGADGAHVGQHDVPVDEARRRVGPGRLVGLSTHSPEQIDAAGAAAPDYIGVGPVHATPTKPGRPAVGLELVRYAAAHAVMPFFAIGGIDAATVPAVREAGGARVAVVRALTEARDPELTARALRAGLEGEVGVGAA
jgi:thiamine-phosphate pyrophosphorylase